MYEGLGRENKSMKNWVETIKVCPTLHTFIVSTQLFILFLSLPNSSYFYCLYSTFHTFIVPHEELGRDNKSLKSWLETIKV
jgi:hypothetical protein